MTAIGHIRGGRVEPIDDDWGAVEATIELDDQVDEARINFGARHPRGNEAWPKVGIFAQRAKARPNRIGVTTCELVGVDGLSVRVRGLDAIDGTPVLDVKPWMHEFAPIGATRQPAWATELMADYYKD